MVGCNDVAMLLKVWTPEWVLTEDMVVRKPGDEFSSWLTFEQAGPATTAERVQVVRGTATPAPWDWPRRADGPYPVRIDVEDGALYWDAPEPVEGDVELTGTVETNNIDAPPGFPSTRCVVRRVRMGWREESRGTYFEEVPTSWLPSLGERPDIDPAVRQAAIQEARQRVPRWRRWFGPGRVTVFLAPSEDDLAAASLRPWWAGLLLDVESVGVEAG